MPALFFGVQQAIVVANNVLRYIVRRDERLLSARSRPCSCASKVDVFLLSI